MKPISVNLTKVPTPMFKNVFPSLPLSKKIPLLFVGMVILTGAVASSLMVFQASDALRSESHAKQEALLKQQSLSLSSYLNSIVSDMQVMTADPEALGALRDLSRGYQEIAQSKNPTNYLQQQYIQANPNPIGSKHLLMRANDASTYSKHHAQYHTWFKKMVDERGYYDVFLVNMSGDVVYTVFKELDFATNLNKGKWKDTDLAKVYRQALQEQKNEGANTPVVAFSDFKAYAPSNNVPASFIARLLRNERGQVEGVLMYQMPIGKINEIMQNDVGMGKTGDTFLLGSDLTYRSDSRFTPKGQTDILKTKLPDTYKPYLTKSASFEGENHGYKTQTFSTPFEFQGVKWTLMTEQSVEEANKEITSMQWSSLILGFLLTALMGAVGVTFGRNISTPIQKLTNTMQALAQGNEKVVVPFKERQDELGEMAHTVEVFKENLVQKNQMDNRLKEMAGNLEAEINGSLGGIKKQIDVLVKTMKSMEEEARQTSDNLKQVTYSASQMSEAANEINARVSQTNSITADASERSKLSSSEISQLNEATHKIEAVIELIRAIMEQTNLLALNATIEAASAGEAGRGFSVVATQVKELAKQTAQATIEISDQIKSVQSEASSGKESIEHITEMLSDLFMASTSIAASVEEQTVTLHDISHNMQNINDNTERFMNQVQSVHHAVETVEKQVDTVESGLRGFLSTMRSK